MWLISLYKTSYIDVVLYAMLLFLALVSFPLPAQTDTSNMVRFNPDYRFADGFFLNFEQVKGNRPILKSRLISDAAYDDPQFFEKLSKSSLIGYYDQTGVRQKVSTRNVWGYARNGVLYINVNNDFYRITLVGNIAHFVASLTTYNYNYNPYPYSYYGHGYPYQGRGTGQPTTEMRQYLLDFYSGKVLDYNVRNLEVLLMNDPMLHDEYLGLRKKKKNQLKFFYIRRFNERNPLYLPANGTM